MNIEGKKITILGAVRSGVGAAKLAKRMKAVPFVSDMSATEKVRESISVIEAEGIECEFGKHSDKIYDADLFVISPGVPSDAPVIIEAQKKNIKIVSELEFASWFCEGNIIAITGTNGKTTTTSLCAHILNGCGLKTYTAGNIGYAFSEIAADVAKNEYVALEVSSFQLDHVEKFKPKFSLILNVTPDHLDRYENSYEKYKTSKAAISAAQTAEDYFIFNEDDKEIPDEAKNSSAKKASFSLKKEVEVGCYFEDKKFCFSDGELIEDVADINDSSLRGEHNYANTLAVLTVAKLLKLDHEKIKAAMKSFPGVEHRLEFVKEIAGVKYINDSKATNVDAVWYALRSFEEPINLILGGKDKGNDYDELKEPVVNNVKKIYAIGSSAQKVYDYFNQIKNCEIKKSLEECLAAARTEASAGEVVLLSPACASFDMFDSYEHRGKVFKEIVNGLT